MAGGRKERKETQGETLYVLPQLFKEIQQEASFSLKQTGGKGGA